MRCFQLVAAPRLLLISCALLLQSCLLDTDEQAVILESCERFQAKPVLFVHGSGLNSSIWDDAIRQFRSIGYPDGYLLAIDLVPNDGDNMAAAESQIRAGIDGLLAMASAQLDRTKCPNKEPSKVVIVAHSMGSMSSRWYAAKVAPEKVASLVTVAGSNHGTDALCAREGAGNRQMCPSYSTASGPSEIQFALNGTDRIPADETPYGIGVDINSLVSAPSTADKRITYLTVRLDPDEWIVPADSALLDGAGGMAFSRKISTNLVETSPGNYLFVESVNHDDLPSHPNLILFLTLVLSDTTD